MNESMSKNLQGWGKVSCVQKCMSNPETSIRLAFKPDFQIHLLFWNGGSTLIHDGLTAAKNFPQTNLEIYNGQFNNTFQIYTFAS